MEGEEGEGEEGQEEEEKLEVPLYWLLCTLVTSSSSTGHSPRLETGHSLIVETGNTGLAVG